MVASRNRLLLVLAVAGHVAGSEVARAEPPAALQVPARPARMPATWLTYHLAHPGPGKAEPGDPNAAFLFRGRYHLHYIYDAPGGFAYAHVSSPDLVRWKWHPTILAPAFTGHGMFSGTGFITKDGRPAIIYHGERSGRNWIVFGLDDTLDRWSKPMAVDVRDAAGEAVAINHWDPDCWVMDDAYFGISGGSDPPLFTSNDLQRWRHLGPLFHERTPWQRLGVDRGEDVSCPNMFKLGDRWMLLCISHGLGARYYLGDFRDGRYLPDRHAPLNWSRWECFAPESLQTADGRRVAWFWCFPASDRRQRLGTQRRIPNLASPDVIQSGIQSLPRELSLADDGTLKIRPVRELQSLRRDERATGDVVVPAGGVTVLDTIAGDTLELEAVFSRPKAGAYGLLLCCDDSGSGGLEVGHGAGRRTLAIDGIEPPFELAENEDLTLRIFIDRSLVEVFANDRQAAVAWHEPSPGRLRIGLFSRGAATTARVRAWTMRSIHEPSE